MLTSPQNKPFIKIPLRFLLMAPFVALIVLAVGLVGYLSYQNGQQAVNNVAHQLRGEINARIAEHLRSFLDTPHRINQINANALRQGWLNAGSQTALERYFWEQIQTFDSVTSIYFGNTAGGLVNAGREGAAGTLYVIVTDGFTQGPFRKYATDSQGNRMAILATVPNFDARTRPWYTHAVAQKGATWSEVYILFTGQDMAISASRPVYDEQQHLMGVVSVDLFLSHLSDFLKSLDIGKTGQSFIIERSGLLVAASTDEQPFTPAAGGIAPQRLEASASTIPLIRGAAAALTNHFGGYQAITTDQQFEFELDGQRQFVQVSPVQNAAGLDWLIVTVIPEADFMTQIKANNQVTIALTGVALMIAVSLGILTAGWITQPMLHLNASAQTLAKGEWGQTVMDKSWIREISELTHSFNTMAEQLRQTLENLTAEIAERLCAEAALRVNLEKYRVLFESFPLGVTITDQTGQIIETNREAARILNVPEEEHLQRRLDSPAWEIIRPDGTPMPATEYAGFRALHEGRLIENVQMGLVKEPGQVTWLNVTAAPIPLEDYGVAIAYGDITQQKQIEEALQESHRSLQEALTSLKETQEKMVQQERLAAVGQLAAGIAHDFNNILTSMLGFAELMQMSPDMPQKMQAMLHNIITPGQRAARLVRQILDFSRKSVRQPQRLDLALFIKETLTFLGRAIPENIHINLDVVPSEYIIEADPTQMQQMLTNLAINARDAMLAGGDLQFSLSRLEVQGQVSCVGCNQVIAGDWLCLIVTDTGNGIAPDVLPHIFEPFFTTKEVGQGSGLGLSQVLGIVKQHGGHVAVNSHVGQGTTLAIYLPPLAG